MRKQTTLKKRTAKSIKARGKKATPATKRKAARKPRKEKTVFTKITDAFDETAGKLKTLFPGENKTNHREDGGTEMP
jgi:hypothetical protein